MSNQLPHDPGPGEIEADLSAYAPRPPRIDRDRLMFEAGRAAVQSQLSAGAAAAMRQGFVAWFPSPPTFFPTSWLWPASTLAMTLVALGLGIALLLRPDPQERMPVVDRVRHAPAASRPATPHPPLLVNSGGLPPTGQQDRPEPPAPEGPVVSLDSLPENHLLRVRQVVLTQGVEALPSPVVRETTRLSPPPTRGALMRTMMPPGSVPARPALFQWRSWFTSGRRGNTQPRSPKHAMPRAIFTLILTLLPAAASARSPSFSLSMLQRRRANRPLSARKS
jgi:hypothetical protein